MHDNNSSTNTVLIVIVLLILVAAGVWWFTTRGSRTDRGNDDAGFNVNVDLGADNSGSGSDN